MQEMQSADSKHRLQSLCMSEQKRFVPEQDDETCGGESLGKAVDYFFRPHAAPLDTAENGKRP